MTKQHLESFINYRYEMLKEAQEEGLTTLERVVRKNIEDAERQLKELKTKITYEQLTLEL